MIDLTRWIPSRRSTTRGGLLVVLIVLVGAPFLTIANAPTNVAGIVVREASPPRIPPAPSLDLDGEGAPPLELAATSGPTVTIPILVYHFVRVVPRAGDPTGYLLSVTPTAFAAQVAFLKSRGVRCLSPDEVFESLRTGRQPTGRVAMLTFDDGFADFATVAAPVLAASGCTATSYVVSGFIGKPGYMTAAQVRAAEQMGMHIGAHTVNHVPLAQMAPQVRVAEIAGSKLALEALLGHPVLDFAYPYGSFNPAVEAAVRAAGFRMAVTTLGGSIQPVADRFALRRHHVNGGDGLSDVAAKLGVPGPAPPAGLSPAAVSGHSSNPPAGGRGFGKARQRKH